MPSPLSPLLSGCLITCLCCDFHLTSAQVSSSHKLDNQHPVSRLSISSSYKADMDQQLCIHIHVGTHTQSHTSTLIPVPGVNQRQLLTVWYANSSVESAHVCPKIVYGQHSTYRHDVAFTTGIWGGSLCKCLVVLSPMPQGCDFSRLKISRSKSSTRYCAVSFPVKYNFNLFFDNSMVVWCINSGWEEDYRELVGGFVEWSGRNHLLLKMDKTKEMIIQEDSSLCAFWEGLSKQWRTTDTCVFTAIAD